MNGLARVLAAVGASLLMMSCGGGSGAPSGSGFIDGFNPPPPPAGYQRFVTPVVTVDAASDETWCQYIAPAFTEDTDVIDVTGEQSHFGHHIVVYATTLNVPVGTSRTCTTDDMLSVRFVGGYGGEAATDTIASVLPKNVVLRVRKGEALVLNTHFINTSSKTVQGQGVVDFKFQSPQPQDQVAGFFTNVNTKIQLAPSEPTVQKLDTNCTVQQDMNFFIYVDHMHALGNNAFSELVQASDGSHVPLSTEPSWIPEYAFNPPLSTWRSPITVHAGDTIHTHCEWINKGPDTVTFPTEMCVGAGFFLPGGGPEIDCVDGAWPTNP